MGESSQIVCFRVIGAEAALGEKAAAITLIAAGRQRGKNLAKDLGLDPNTAVEAALPLLQKALGKDGTRLCAD